jgi:hypothetical protein
MQRECVPAIQSVVELYWLAVAGIVTRLCVHESDVCAATQDRFAEPSTESN